jgi:uncharacterized protein (DUF1697 family)
MMKMERLREVFSGLGFTNVSTVIASGNVLFDLPGNGKLADRAVLEARIEKAISTNLGFQSATMVRTREELQTLVDANPFAKIEVSQKPHVTFLKDLKRKPSPALATAGEGYAILNHKNGAICFVIDLTQTGSPKVMTNLEKAYGKEITTRTWGTVQKVLQKMQS